MRKIGKPPRLDSAAMVRMLRRVLRLSLLARVGVGILKVVKGRKAHDPWAESWVSTGAPATPRPVPATAPAPETPKAETSASPETTEESDADSEESDKGKPS